MSDSRGRSFFDLPAATGRLLSRLLMPRQEPTYTAFYQQDHSKIIYRRRPDGGRRAAVPGDVVPAEAPRRTSLGTGGGDLFEVPLFRDAAGEIIVVQKDGHA